MLGQGVDAHLPVALEQRDDCVATSGHICLATLHLGLQLSRGGTAGGMTCACRGEAGECRERDGVYDERINCNRSFKILEMNVTTLERAHLVMDISRNYMDSNRNAIGVKREVTL